MYALEQEKKRKIRLKIKNCEKCKEEEKRGRKEKDVLFFYLPAIEQVRTKSEICLFT